MAANMNARTKKETLVWTDDEAELLLLVILDYKKARMRQNVDWESCPSKYSDIMDTFEARYPRHPTNKDFPHDIRAITKAQVSAKVKSMRGKYRQAVETGRRSGQGRVVLLFFELCEEIWGSPPAPRCMDAGVETGDLEESPSRPSSSPTFELSADSPHSIDSHESLSPEVAKQRKDVLQVRLNGHRGNRLKRKLPADLAVQEDLQIKKRMLELMEESIRRNADNMQQINTNIANITNTIQEGFSLMRELLLQPQAMHTPAFMHIIPKTEQEEQVLCNGTATGAKDLP